VAKLEGGGPLSLKDVNKMRGKLHIKRGRGGQLIAQKWPRRRGKQRSALQQAWIDDFKVKAQRSKLPDSCSMDVAKALANHTGWYYRDVLERAMSGKLLQLHNHDFGPDPPHFLQRVPGLKQYEGTLRVLSPTASIYAASPTTFTNQIYNALPASNFRWDNNAFFDLATPTRLTAKSSGLYLLAGTLEWSQLNGSWRRGAIRVNGTTQIAIQTVNSGINIPVAINLIAIYPLAAGDYVELQCQKGSSSNLACRMVEFQILGITPESIL